ncbi:MAG: histidinol-phosphate transaminase [Kiritimatiellia bacterium]
MSTNPRVKHSVAAMCGYAPGEQLRRPGLVKLNTNENPYPPSPAVTAALHSFTADDLRRYPDPVCTELRALIAGRHAVAPEQVFVGNGSDEILALATRAFVEDDGQIGFLEPSYSLYPVLAAIRGVSAVMVELDPVFDVRLPETCTASLFLLANPNAPTGRICPVEAVAAFAKSFAGVLLVDEAYADFASDNAMRLAASCPNVLVMRTLSKSYSLAGLRLGYVVGPADLIAAFYTIKDSYNVDLIAQRVAVAALRDEPCMRANVARVQATRVRLTARLAALDYDVTPSESNFLWVRPPAHFPAREVYARLKAQDILVRYFAGLRTGAHLRITVGTDQEVDRLLTALQALNGAAGEKQ